MFTVWTSDRGEKFLRFRPGGIPAEAGADGAGFEGSGAFVGQGCAVEPGAQGEHKIARGFLPTHVRSRHWIADPAFADALRHWCAEETASVRRWKALLDTRSPCKK